MPVERISSVYRANNQYKGFNSYHQSKRIKITELPIDKPKVEQEEKPNAKRRLSSWLMVAGFFIVYGLLNGWIGG